MAVGEQSICLNLLQSTSNVCNRGAAKLRPTTEGSDFNALVMEQQGIKVTPKVENTARTATDQ
jgi:hypothetical protein